MSGVVARGTYSGEDIIKALQKWGFQVVPGGGKGSHTKLRYKDPNTSEVRTVIVPNHDEIAPGTLRDIASDAGAKDFQKFLDAIDDLA